jgi:small-conductance mechanosensitive channel
MTHLLRLACLVLLLAAGTALAQDSGQPQRPFSQLIDLWTRQLDRIGGRADQVGLLPVEIDGLREQVLDVRAAATAAANLARNELADTRKLLAPLEAKPAADAVPETDAVKADRQRMTDQATISESRIKQCEVIVARADQLHERLTKRRAEVMLQTLLRRDASPLSPQTWSKLGPQFVGALDVLASALATWMRQVANGLQIENRSLVALTAWAVLTVVLWWFGRTLRRRYGKGEALDVGERDRTVVAAIDGVGLVLGPMLAVWLIGRALLATTPPAPIDFLVTQFTTDVIAFLLVIGLTAAALSPSRPAWRVLPFTDDSAHVLSNSLRRLFAIVLTADFLYVALARSNENTDALTSIGALVLATLVAAFTMPALATAAWHAERPEGSDLPSMIGGTWWSIARLTLSLLVLLPIILALLGYVTLAAHLHNAVYTTALLITVAVLLHRVVGALLESAAAADTRPGQWVRHRLSLPSDATLRGQHIIILLFDVFLVLLLAVGIPTAWGVDTDAVGDGITKLLYGVKVGGITISLSNIGIAIIAFVVCIGLARLVRSVVRDRVLPTVDAPLPLRQSIDAGLNYLGVAIALLIGVGALGIDFTNLAIVLGALSVGIGLGLQNIANNVISGVILLVERPIKAGDWVVVSGHEGFVRRINIRATEIETFQRTHVIVPNSIFLQNPVVNRTYADTSSRIEIKLTVGLGTDVAVMEGLLREAALGHPNVLRVPAPIVRFTKVGSNGLDFELFVFVALLEHRLVVSNDLNKTILARLIELKIIDPAPVPEFRLRGIESILSSTITGQEDGHAQPPT